MSIIYYYLLSKHQHTLAPKKINVNRLRVETLHLFIFLLYFTLFLFFLFFFFFSFTHLTVGLQGRHVVCPCSTLNVIMDYATERALFHIPNSTKSIDGTFTILQLYTFFSSKEKGKYYGYYKFYYKRFINSFYYKLFIN